MSIDLARRIARAAASGFIPVFVPLDLETTVQKIGKNYSPLPYGPNGAYAFAGGYGTYRFYEKDPVTARTHRDRFAGLMVVEASNPYVVVCGHNLKFDFQHLPAVPSIMVWDTMVAEYILSGQQDKMVSLADLQQHYGLAVKRDLIGENLVKGITPDQIPETELMEYLEYDLSSVAAIAEAQFRRAVSAGCVALILTQGLATQAYAYAERNGMPLDVGACVGHRDYHDAAAAVILGEIAEGVRALCGVPMGVPDEDLTTPRVLSMAFWGVPVNAKIKVPLQPGDLRVGNHKFKTVTITSPVIAKTVPYAGLGLDAQALRTGNPWLKLDDAVLNKIQDKWPGSTYGDLATTVLAWRHHKKLLGTYYQPLLEHAGKFKDGTVHHTINQCIAATGRTTSERPNSQNIPSDVRQVIIPPGVGGGLLEVDFRQLEICALAQISGDPALIAALNAGDDIHYLTGQLVYGYKSKADETSERRRIIKTINFGLAYGGGAFTLAEQAGVDVQTARDAIEAFYKRFPGTRAYNDKYFEDVVRSPESGIVRAPEPTEYPTTHRVHTMNSPTGRRYVYEEQDTPDWLRRKTGALVSFSPTQTKNYPIQGFATGDIVPLAAGLLAQHPLVANWIHNLVHDSILLSYRDNSELLALLCLIEDLTHNLPDIIHTIWPNITMQVPLRAETKTGPNWGDLSPIIEALE